MAIRYQNGRSFGVEGQKRAGGAKQEFGLIATVDRDEGMIGAMIRFELVITDT